MPKNSLFQLRDNLLLPDCKSGDVVFVSGNFNILHPGHLRLLKFAKECGDILVVGLNPDSSDGITVRGELRLEAMQSNSLIDYCFLMEDAVEEVINILRPSAVVKGPEFANRLNQEQSAVDSYGGRVLFCSGEVRLSGSDLFQRELFKSSQLTFEKPTSYISRHPSCGRTLIEHVSRFKDLSVVVLGDLIIDQYTECQAIGMSQEDPTLVVTPIAEKQFLGGSGIVAAHARQLGAKVNYFSVVGDDLYARTAKKFLSENDVDFSLIVDRNRPTTNKKRFRANGKTLLRVNQMHEHDLEEASYMGFLDRVESIIVNADLIIFSDFNYGALPQKLIQTVVGFARKGNAILVADSQSSSQIGNILRFKGMDLITPTERELRIALHDRTSGLVSAVEQARRVCNAKNIVVTLNEEGVLISGNLDGQMLTDVLPALNRNPKDTAGAGDSFLVCSAMALATGLDIWASSYLGTIGAACQVESIGNKPLSVSDLLHHLT